MRLLVDTHVLLWVLADEPRVGPEALAALEGSEERLVSVATVWEVAIKVGLGKLDAPEDLPAVVVESGFDLLPVDVDHAWAVRDLPMLHRDPFDRLLVSQAKATGLTLVTADEAVAAYDVAVLDARR